MAEFATLTRPKAPDVDMLRQIAGSIGWRSYVTSGSYYRCEFCRAKDEYTEDIPHAADCPVPPFRAWVKSLEQEKEQEQTA